MMWNRPDRLKLIFLAGKKMKEMLKTVEMTGKKVNWLWKGIEKSKESNGR